MIYLQGASYGSQQQAIDAVEKLFCSLEADEANPMQQEQGVLAADTIHRTTDDAQLAAHSGIKGLLPDAKVLLKPNLLAKHPPQRAVTTHPDVVRAIIIALQKRGIKNITLADSPGGVHNAAVLRSIYKTSGLAKVCDELGVTMYTGSEEGVRAVPAQYADIVHNFKLLKPVMESDFIINLPKLKTHTLTGMSGAVKNQFGCVQGLQKGEFHMQFPEKKHFAKMLVALSETVRANLHIVDGILGMEGDGPGSGTPRETNVLLAAKNPYQLDLAICHLMGINPMQTPVLAAANAYGLCGEQIDLDMLAGEKALQLPFENFVLPKTYTGEMNFDERVPKFLRPLVPLFEKWAAPRPIMYKNKCIGCAKCAEICPQKVIDMQKGKASITYKNCIKCFCCHEICPVKAIDVSRRKLFKM